MSWNTTRSLLLIVTAKTSTSVSYNKSIRETGCFDFKNPAAITMWTLVTYMGTTACFSKVTKTITDKLKMYSNGKLI